jgi:2-dehydropantoate 2-reductase
VAILQNGVDHVERIRPLVPVGTRLVPVVIQLPSEKRGPGDIEQSHVGLLFVPEDDDGRAFAALFAGARTPVRPTPDFRSQAWWKLLSNAALGGVCALALQPNRIAGEPGVRELVVALMQEIAAVGRADGANLPDDAPEKVLERVLGAAPDHWSSISVDRREGRPMEWEVRNEVVGRLGRRYGIATPLNDAITALLRAADASAKP